MNRGIDYSPSGSTVNRDPLTGIRYGIIHNHKLGEWAFDEFEARYTHACPHCGADWPEDLDTPADCPECEERVRDGEEIADEPNAHTLDADGYRGFIDSSGDAWCLKSPYFTRAAFCSPCAPGAGDLNAPCEDGERVYAWGHEWFDGEAPYPVYMVSTGEQVLWIKLDTLGVVG